MLIETLVRLGRPFLSESAALPPGDLVGLLTSSGDRNAGRFYASTFIVEIDRERMGSGASLDESIAVHGPLELAPPAQSPDQSPVQEAPEEARGGPGSEGSEPPAPDPRRQVLPFSLPTGGSPTAAQGRYPVPAYPVYKSSMLGFLDRGKGSKDAGTHALRRFLHNRAGRTLSGLSLSEAQLDSVATKLAGVLQSAHGATEDGDVGEGLILICEVGDGSSPYTLERPDTVPDERPVALVESGLHAGQTIRALPGAVLDGVLKAKPAEGAVYGRNVGEDAGCGVCGRRGVPVVSGYSNAWPFAGQKWAPPLQDATLGGGKPNFVLSVALCEDECYPAYSVGARIFFRLSRPIPVRLRKEIFAPGRSGPARQWMLLNPNAAGNLPPLKVAAYPLPLLPELLSGEDERAYVRAVTGMLDKAGAGASAGINPSTDGPLTAVLGAESSLPEVLRASERASGGISGGNFTLTAVYYGQDATRKGVVDLYATAEDVVPSRLVKLEALVRSVAGRDSDGDTDGDADGDTGGDVDEDARWASAALGVRPPGERGLANLPYLLSRAYGRGGAFSPG